jgi:hypothetical protein
MFRTLYCLRFQVEATQLGSIDIADFCLRTGSIYWVHLRTLNLRMETAFSLRNVVLRIMSRIWIIIGKCGMASSGMLCRVALVRTDVSVERIASTTKVTRIAELGTTLAVTSNRRTLRRNTTYYVY